MLARLTLLILLVPAYALAQVPNTISFQGTLADSSSGAPTTGTVSMDLSLHTLAVGGSQLWSETQPSVQVVDGLFNVMIGSVTPLDPADFAVQRFLEIEVNSEAIGDRIPLVTVPFAFRAAIADTATFVQNLCNQGDFLNCYTGSPPTMGVGECKSGVRTCSPDGTGFATCTGEVLPITEECVDGQDDDCDGVVDDGCCIENDVEPNDSQATATFIGAINDCAGPGARSESGTLADGSDIDWYKFLGDDSTCAFSPELSRVSDSGPVEICLYFDCQNGTGTSVTCNSGSTSTSPLPNELKGCCTTGSSLNPSVSCDGTSNETSDIFMSMSSPGATSCNNYQLSYGL